MCILHTKRFFIPCQPVTTTSTFLSAIASSLDVDITKGDPLKLIINTLRAENIPLMLVFDNAESFWFDYKIQPHARTILRHICSICTITLLLTIRGTERPNVTLWDPLPLLGPFTLPHARDVFLQIATDVEPDASLDNLLMMVDCVPLALSLLARRCQIMGESAASLCSRWEREHIELLKLGGVEADDNIDISIKLSLDSPLMRGNGNALRLLSVVSHFPAGISNEACSSMSLTDAELSAAEFLLRRLSLTYSPVSGWITTLEPIRAYMRQQDHLQVDDLHAIENWHVNLASTHGHHPDDAEFPLASGKLIVNNTNISFVLRSHIQQHRDLAVLANAILAFSAFLQWTRPNGDLLEMLLSASTNDLDRHVKARCLQRLGNILLLQNQHQKAQLKLEEAHLVFINIGDRLGAAQCLRSVGNILRVRNQYKEAWLKLEEAQLIFIDIGDRLGAAQCLRSLGNILRMQNQYEEARLKLEEARSIFIDTGDQLGAARCLQLLGTILRMQSQYEEALLKLEEARSIFVHIGDRRGVARCQENLGDTLRMQNQYEEARSVLEEARLIFIDLGDRLGTAHCLQRLGDILQMQDRYEEAQSKLEEARLIFIDISARLEVAQCLQSLAHILRVQNQHNEARLKLEEARLVFIDIGHRLGAAQCLQSLGDMLRVQNHYDEAQLKLEEARPIFIDIDDRVGAARCLQSLAHILEMQNQYEQAQLRLEEARSIFIDLGDQLAAAQCTERLDNIMRELSRDQAKLHSGCVP